MVRAIHFDPQCSVCTFSSYYNALGSKKYVCRRCCAGVLWYMIYTHVLCEGIFCWWHTSVIRRPSRRRASWLTNHWRDVLNDYLFLKATSEGGEDWVPRHVMSRYRAIKPPRQVVWVKILTYSLESKSNATSTSNNGVVIKGNYLENLSPINALVTMHKILILINSSHALQEFLSTPGYVLL